MLKNKKVLITCGPTWVPIDDMRIIGNQSTGTLGQLLAEDFAREGAKVTLLEGPVAKQAQSKVIRILKFTFFNEFVALLKKELKKKYAVCIHAAAVSDYKVKKPLKTKLRSQLKSLKLELVPTQKIINLIKRLNPNLVLVGFKLESKLNNTSARVKARSLIDKSKCDFVVANSTRGKKYSGYILNNKSVCLSHNQSRKQLSKALVNIMKVHI